MDQLSLFPGGAERHEAPIAALGVDQAQPEPGVDAHPSQIGLFDARVRELRAVRQAIASGELGEALDRLRSIEAGSDFDPSAMQKKIARISAQISDASRWTRPESAAATAALGRRIAADGEPWSSLGRRLLVRAAASVEDDLSPLAGRLYQEAGDLERARSVLASALERHATASLLFALGDVETLRGNRTAARRCYRDALLLDPFDAAFDTVIDDEVRALPQVAEGDVEIESEPRAWAAAVGIVAGVLASPGQADLTSPEPDPIPTAAFDALVRMRNFVRALGLTAAPDGPPRPNALIEARRAMKQASPALFAWYMARRTGSERGPSLAPRFRSAPSGSGGG
jgi:tetratricopeptide (TPR) repeat protein